MNDEELIEATEETMDYAHPGNRHKWYKVLFFVIVLYIGIGVHMIYDWWHNRWEMYRKETK